MPSFLKNRLFHLLWISETYHLIRKELHNGKLKPVSTPSILIGIEENNHNYQLLDLNSDKIVVIHDVTFQPLVFLARKAYESLDPDWDLIEDQELTNDTKEVEEDVLEPIVTPRRGEEDDINPLIIPIRNEHERPKSPEDVNSGEDLSKIPRQRKEDIAKDSGDQEKEEEDYDESVDIEISPPKEPLHCGLQDIITEHPIRKLAITIF
ncbi:hypothetical protein CROQUDRAFT_98185 [Cronartium quercuum f. sp. fusiforme G11]|uniref:Retroviral polymerase SH3-like domain-containing protein n=1 Tax=Cronartium quercuum f. sp. fusiforme G11 TaxID=708437 RepID=A0A9P6N8H8_9BASI|nr:hypothetical protein CROQUDRAFT_98185 [Cronartium quercuum f. sp. fusiforme G11]